MYNIVVKPIQMKTKDLKRAAHAWNAQVMSSLKRYGIEIIQNGPSHQIRLLNWKAWTIRYSVSLDWIVDHILQYYSKAREARRSTKVLGLTTAAITGEKIQSWIQECVNKEFPSGENIAVKRCALKAKMIGLPASINTNNNDVSVEQYLRDYRFKAEELRNRTAVVDTKFNRPWRGNPFK